MEAIDTTECTHTSASEAFCFHQWNPVLRTFWDHTVLVRNRHQAVARLPKFMKKDQWTPVVHGVPQ